MKTRREGSLLDRKALYTYIAQDNGTTFVDTRTWCDAIFRSISRALTEGRDVQLPEIGRFYHYDTAPRKMTKSFGADYVRIVPAKRRLKFKIMNSIVDAVLDLPLVSEEIGFAEEAADDSEG